MESYYKRRKLLDKDIEDEKLKISTLVHENLRVSSFDSNMAPVLKYNQETSSSLLFAHETPDICNEADELEGFDFKALNTENYSDSECSNDSHSEHNVTEACLSSESWKPAPGIYDEKLGEAILEWKMKCNTPDSHVDSLLSIFQPYIKGLPKACTKLSSEKEIHEVIDMKPGEYVHFGVRRSLIDKMKRGIRRPIGIGKMYLEFENEVKAEGCKLLTLSFNVDGLPLFKSSQTQFWAIACCVHEFVDSQPFLVGLYCGPRKPESAEDFLRPLIDELKSLTSVILECDNERYRVKVLSFICDTPARCFIKGAKIFHAYYGCEYCIQKGERLKEAGKTVFPNLYAPKRHDGDENNPCTNNYFHCRTGLGDICGIISQIPPDPMHCCYLGVMKHLLYTWLRSTRKENFGGRLSPSCIREFDARARSLQRQIPKEFRRNLRTSSDLERMKAKEFRLLLLYVGPVLFRCLPQEHYSHFLLLHFAIYVLNNDKWFLKFGKHAHACLEKFVQTSSKIYSLSFLTYNIHLLQHIEPYTETLGVLNIFSAFSFENFLKKVKGVLNSPYKPLKQVANRFSYLSLSNSSYRLHFSTRSPDNCAVTDKGIVLIIKTEENVSGTNRTFVSGYRLVPSRSLYDSPYDSMILGIGFYKESKVYVSNVAALNKAFALRTENDNIDKSMFIVIPFVSANYYS